MTMYRRRLLCLALALCMMITLIPAATGTLSSARAAAKRMGITLDKVNVRYGAGTGEKIMFGTMTKAHAELTECGMVKTGEVSDSVLAVYARKAA